MEMEGIFNFCICSLSLCEDQFENHIGDDILSTFSVGRQTSVHLQGR